MGITEIDVDQHLWQKRLMQGQLSHRQQLRHIRENGSLNYTPKKIGQTVKRTRQNTLRTKHLDQTVTESESPKRLDAVPKLLRVSMDNLPKKSQIGMIQKDSRIVTAENAFSPRISIKNGTSSINYSEEQSIFPSMSGGRTHQVYQRSIMLQPPSAAKSFRAPAKQKGSLKLTLQDLHHDILLESERQRTYRSPKEIERLDSIQKEETDRVNLFKEQAIARGEKLRKKLQFFTHKNKLAAPLLEEMNITSEMYEQSC